MFPSLHEQALLTTLLTQPHRHYHNTTHIMDCLAELQQYEKTNRLDFNDRVIITRSIWYHDVVYNSYATPGRNELESAEMAQEDFDELHPEALSYISEGIYRTIRMTAYHTEVQNVSSVTEIMLDIDLSGLGKEWAVYMRNSENIRKEYYNTSDYDFANGRIKFLEAMLKREKIYYTDHFSALYEQSARENMSNELAILKESLK